MIKALQSSIEFWSEDSLNHPRKWINEESRTNNYDKDDGCSSSAPYERLRARVGCLQPKTTGFVNMREDNKKNIAWAVSFTFKKT